MSSLDTNKVRVFGLNRQSNKSPDQKFTLNEKSDQRILKEKPGKDLECIEGRQKIAERRSFSEKESELLLNATILLKNKEYDLAKRLYYAVLNENPYNDLAVKSLGRLSLLTKNFDEAGKYFNALLQMRPGFESYKLNADYFFEIQDFGNAMKHYSAALECNEYNGPYLFDIYKNLGNIQIHLGDLEAAEEAYNRAFRIEPKSDVLLVNFGTLELQKGNFDGALEKFREAVEINPKNDKAWVGLALIHRSFADKELSWANIEAALDFNNNNKTALKLAIEWAFLDGKTGRIISRLEKFTANNQKDPLMYFMLAKILYMAGRYQHADIELFRAVSLDPMLEGADELRKEIDLELKRIKESIK